MGGTTALPAKLKSRLREFLSTLRLGIDFGEHAGGIALVRENTILHAETFLDFHQATLEQRRALRRGRRTRHAKKMRLARLRSWIMRQRLASGKRLPDPYHIMRDMRYMVAPGVYHAKGAQPATAPGWVQLARAGQVTAAGFVRALTLIFQKRGYKWDAIALQEMNDSRLKDFLQNARIPSDDLANAVRAQIQRRKADPEDPARGKKKVPPEELEELLAEARGRGNLPPQPRVAEHRSVKEDELRAVIEGFGRAAGLPQPTLETWKEQLVRLLNKALRLPRFDNRLKSGCSWCGRATPRKSKVREPAYWAAVNNLRVRRWPQPPRRLSEEELAAFRKWWAEPAKAPGVETIKRHLKKLGAQAAMARQFHDLLKNPSPSGRASLCLEHLRLAAQGQTMKDAGVDWQTISVRKAPNPCRERRDLRVLRRLEQILFRPGKKGADAWRHGPVQFLTLEIPEPQTERAHKGEQKQRQQEKFLDRLLAEFGGTCAYAALGDCSGQMDKDHIFPRSREGPDVRVNLVPCCKAHNEAKGNRTPFEWLCGDSARWEKFRNSVSALPIVQRKKEILLSEEPDYPEGNPTTFARAGARARQFVVDLRKLFEGYGVSLPRLDYQLGEPLVQRLLGSETHRLRRSWLRKPDGTPNFPPKDRTDVYNHAQDAALMAAAPPHTWRETIFRHRALRPNRNGEWVEQPGLAIPELAPDWATFMDSRTFPLVRVLGRYPVTWKTSFADQTFAREPEDLEAAKLRISEQVENIKVSNLEKIVSPYWRDRLAGLARELGLSENQTIRKEKLSENFPGLRRVQLERQRGGKLATLRPADGPPRKVQIKRPSEGAVVWEQQVGQSKKRLQARLSLIRPRPLRRLGFPRVDPPVPSQATVLGRLRRHQIIWLDATARHAAGFYRLTKFELNRLTAMPENAMPKEIAGRLKLKPGAEQQSEAQPNSVSLGLKELAAYFRALRSAPENSQGITP